MRAPLQARAAVDREERRIERELRRHRKLTGEIIDSIAGQVARGPAAQDLLTIAQALETAARAQRTAADALLSLARVRIDRLRAELQADDEPEDELGAGGVH